MVKVVLLFAHPLFSIVVKRKGDCLLNEHKHRYGTLGCESTINCCEYRGSTRGCSVNFVKVELTTDSIEEKPNPSIKSTITADPSHTSTS